MSFRQIIPHKALLCNLYDFYNTNLFFVFKLTMCPRLLFFCSITGSFEVLGVALGMWKGMIMGIHPSTASQDVNAACLLLSAQGNSCVQNAGNCWQTLMVNLTECSICNTLVGCTGPWWINACAEADVLGKDIRRFQWCNCNSSAEWRATCNIRLIFPWCLRRLWSICIPLRTISFYLPRQARAFHLSCLCF